MLNKTSVFVKKVKTSSVRKSRRKSKYKTHSDSIIKSALESVKKGNSLRKVSKEFSIPLSTLHRKKKGLNTGKRGAPTVLKYEEEQEIVKWVVHRANIGCPATKKEVAEHIQVYLNFIKRPNPFTDGMPGPEWFRGFKRRNPNISIRTAQCLESLRDKVIEEDLREWFSMVIEYLKSKNLVDIDPSRIFNCDETNIQLNPKPNKVLAEKGASNVMQTVDGNDKEGYTVLFTYGADGSRAPPLVLFRYKSDVSRTIIQKMPVGWGVGSAENGFMQKEDFFEYVTNVFHPWLINKGVEFPVILYCDGHTSHVTIPLIKFCQENKIELIILFPHSTHITQPLDIAFFSPFKRIKWKEAVRDFKQKNNRRGLKIEDFSPVLNSALESYTNEKQVIISGFKSSGLYPLDPDAVEYNVLAKRKRKSSKRKFDAVDQHNNDAVTPEFVKDFKNHLKLTLSPELINLFENCDSWPTDEKYLQYKGLFEYWSAIKNGSKKNCTGRYI